MKKIKTLTAIRSYVFVTIGLFINVIGWTAFLIPHTIVGGGVSGIGTLIYYASGFPVGITILIINAFLVLLAMRILGANFGIKTIYSILAVSFFFYITPFFMPQQPIITERFMSALLGGMLAGVGIGIAFINGGNSGGTDIIALIITKYRNISPGKILLYIDLFIIGSSFLLPPHLLETIVYGYVSMGVAYYTLDLVIDGNRQAYQIMIFSEHYEQIADHIVQEVGRGVTTIHGKGWYNKQEKEVLLVIARKQDKQNIFRIINEIDPRAFISIAKVAGVFGQNFDKLKF